VRSARPLVAPIGVVLALAACGRVTNQAPADAVPTDAWAASCAPTALITRVEAADSGYANECVHGEWFLQSFNGTTTPATNGPGDFVPVVPTVITIGSNPLDSSSTYAVHVTGSGQENTTTSSTFVQLNASLNAPSATQQGTVDATAYTGIQFYAIISTGTTGARLTVADLYTDPIGGLCKTNPPPGDKTACFDHPGAQLMIGTTWMKYTIRFDSLTQLGFGNQSPLGAQFPRNAITLLKWDIGIPSTGPTAPWELWIDDLTFY
jgi:hypothetical protein